MRLCEYTLEPECECIRHISTRSYDLLWRKVTQKCGLGEQKVHDLICGLYATDRDGHMTGILSYTSVLGRQP